MKNVCLPVYFFLFLFPHPAWSQEYSYMHYDIGQGLAGSTLYCITQDKNGFIWTGTQAGVSRFDGSHFKNFTTRDGLPDLEILQIFGDSKGRVWMAPFRKSICYYYLGKIHNQENDSLLSHIHLQHNIEGFAEDAGGDILIQERNALHLVGSDGSLVTLDSLDHEPIQGCLAVCPGSSGQFLAQSGQKIIEFSGSKVIRSMNIPFSWTNQS
jgi:ligand-binding sensor domain-containing protein